MHRLAVLTAAAGLAACSGSGGSGLGAMAPYAPANAFYPVGYSETALSADRYQVRASGTETTPYERLEKIATARAAEIGAGLKKSHFKIAGVTRDLTCGKKREGYKAANTPATSHPVVTVDVIYTSGPADPSFQSTKDTFQRLSEELKTDTYSPESSQAVQQDVSARCKA